MLQLMSLYIYIYATCNVFLCLYRSTTNKRMDYTVRLTWKDSTKSSTSTRTHHPNRAYNGCDLSDAGIFMCHFCFVWFSLLLLFFWFWSASSSHSLCVRACVGSEFHFDFLVAFILCTHFLSCHPFWSFRQQIDFSFHH